MESLKLLMWKNFTVMWRTKTATLIEIIVPLVPVLVFVLIRVALKVKEVNHPSIYDPFSPGTDVPRVARDICNVVYYAPSNPKTDSIMQNAKLEYFDKAGLHYTFQGFNRPEQLLKSYEEVFRGKPSKGRLDGKPRTINDTDILLAAVIFENVKSKSLPKEIKYTIRLPACQKTFYDSFRERNNLKPGWFTDFTFPPAVFTGPRSRNFSQGGFPGYYDEGFLYLQSAVERSISNLLMTSEQQKEMDEYDIQLQRFPFPPYRDDKFHFTVQSYLAFYIAFAFVYSIMNLTKMIVHEKSSRLKEFMKIMGLDDWVHWTAWFLRSFILLAISSVFIVILLKIKLKSHEACLTESNPLLIFGFLIAAVISVIGFAFLCSTFFDDEQSAGTFAGLVWILLLFSNIVLFLKYPMMKLRDQRALALAASPIAMLFSSFIIGARERAGEGLKKDNFWDGYSMDDEFSVGQAIILMVANGIIYSFAAFYIQLTIPGKYGVPLPWYFPFTKWFWTGSPREAKGVEPIVKIVKTKRTDVFEKEPTHEKAGIDIIGVNKVYSSRVAVNNLTMKMFENQVTSLLGHNGAGKSTTMSILTGLTKPSSGTALVNGFDIRKNMPSVRASIGLCPQYNILFDDLTVAEHIRFYCKLKGLGEAQVMEEIDRCVKVLNLEDKRDVASKNLSGGMKRKLCVGMAFSADSKVVLLDEPTAGMDPGARRSTWDLIQAQKAGRTVLLSTHYMEEADLLGDRIAIMAQGQLQCCGSSLFLKSKYGGDYTIIIVKKNNCNVEKIKRLVLSSIPGAEFRVDVGAELSFILPGDQIQLFSALFEKLDNWKEQQVFESYGVCSTTMEQVFFRVGEDAEGKHGDDHKHKKPSNSKKVDSQTSLNMQNHQSYSVTELFKKNETVNSDKDLWTQQIKAMLMKKLLYGIRNKMLFLLQVLLPVLLVGHVLWMMSFYPGQKSEADELTFELESFEDQIKTTTLISCPYNSTACQGYRAFMCGKFNTEEVDDESLTPVILDLIEKQLIQSTGENILGFNEVPSAHNSTKVTIIGYFNNQHLHTPPLALNYISNGFLRAFGIQNKLTVTLHPFDFDDSDDVGLSEDSFDKPFSVGLALGISLAFLSASFIIFPVQELQIKFKQLQIIAGVRLTIYWLVHYCVDYTVYFVCCLGAFAVILLYDVDQYKKFDIFMKYLVIVGFYGWAMLWTTMLLTRVVKSAQSGYSKIVSVNAGVGFLGIIAVTIIRAPDFDLKKEADAAHTMFLFHPNYAVGSAILYLGVHHDLHKYCPTGEDIETMCYVNPESACCKKLHSNYFHWKASGIGRHIFHMAMVGLVSLGLLILVESGLLRRWKARLFRSGGSSSLKDSERSDTMELLDVDVSKEIRRINQANLSTLFNTDNLVVRNLTKTYGGKFQAVKAISFGVPKGETFGLLGSNGAGKTTTFKMLTGDIGITSGDAFINSYSVTTNLHQAHAHLGYCPQFDACLDQLTARETLTMFSQLKGIMKCDMTAIIEKLAEDLLFTKFLDKKFEDLSGGNKRKLSTALAMLGSPATIFLDEPTAGMDPVACRHVWDAVNKVRDDGSSVILTSHNMEECEALCSSLGIMVKGQFRCIGSPQHLKNKLSQGYTLMVQLSYAGPNAMQSIQEDSDEISETLGDDWETRLDEFSEFLMETFPGCVLRDAHPGFAEYHIPQSDTPWSKLFGTLEEAKIVFHLDAYTVGQNNLEQVFFTYTTDQGQDPED